VNSQITELDRQNWGKVIVDQARMDLLERLYEWDGRSNPEHPNHHTYTGLYLKYNQI
jgi:hypothetical protein